jgi:predicted TIM-barrel fold metal-dependent hydrolase
VPRRVFDCCVHHHWASQDEIVAYLTPGWQEYLNQPKAIRGEDEAPIPILPNFPYHRPEGDKLADSWPADGAPGTSLDLIREQLLDRYDIERAVLCHDSGMHIPLHPNTYLGVELTRAINQWTIDRWLAEEERLHALMLVPSRVPDCAAEEIHRFGSNPKIAGVLMAANGLSSPFGHPNYHPIYRAAAEWELPIVFHAGGDAPGEALSHIAAGGLPTMYGEYHILRPLALWTHLTSMIVQGVFEKYPGLRVLVLGAGAAWVPSVFWRLDTEYRSYRREVPWVTKMPSEYLRDSIRIGTWPLDRSPTPQHLHRLLGAFGDCEELLVYASGYPDWDFDTPEAAIEQLPDSWAERVLYRNADEFFRWDAPSGPTATSESRSRVGLMK